MRKLLIAAAAAVAVLAVAGAALAANQYGLTDASTFPKGKGSPSKPVAKGVAFDFTVKDEKGPRGAPVKDYKIAFQGLTHKYASRFKKCSFSDTASDAPLATIEAKCKQARLGSGHVESLVALDASAGDPNAVFAYCNLQLTLYAIPGGISIRLDADNTPPLPTGQGTDYGCLVNTHRAIQAKFRNVKIAGVPSSSLEFTVPDDLRHNSGFTITVAKTESTVQRKTTKAKVAGERRTVGFYSAIGCGKRNKRVVRVTFKDENGVSSNESKKVRC